MKLKSLAFWRKIAIILCFVLAIGAGTAGALLPAFNRAFAEGDAQTKAVASLTVTYNDATLEKGIADAEYDQLKKYLTVVADDTELTREQYEVTAVTYDGANGATVTVSYNGTAATTAGTIVAVDPVLKREIKVEAPEALTVNGETKTLYVDGEGYYWSNGLGGAKDKVRVYFTDLSADAVLRLLDVSLQYQHVSKKLTQNGNAWTDGTAGVVVNNVSVTNNAFKEGEQDVKASVTVNGETYIGETPLYFSERKVVEISAEWTRDWDTIQAGEYSAQGAIVSVHDDLRKDILVKAYVNDGSEPEILADENYIHTTLFPDQTSMVGKWTSEENAFTYDKYTIEAKYAFDSSITATVQKENKNVQFLVNAAKPYMFTGISGNLPEQSVGAEWDFSGMTLGVSYAAYTDGNLSGMHNLNVPLNEIDKQYLVITYKSSEEESKAADSNAINLKTIHLDSKNNQVPKDVKANTTITLEFIYNNGITDIPEKINGSNDSPQGDSSKTPMQVVGEGSAAFWFANYTSCATPFQYDKDSTAGMQFYRFPEVEVQADYFVEYVTAAAAKRHIITLGSGLSAAIREGREVLRLTVANGVGSSALYSVQKDQTTQAVTLSVLDAESAVTETVENGWKENADGTASLAITFPEAGSYTLSFSLYWASGLWENMESIYAYSIALPKRELKVQYSSSKDDGIFNDFETWKNAFRIGFYNKDNDTPAYLNLPDYTLKLYNAGAGTITELGRAQGGFFTWASGIENYTSGVFYVYAEYANDPYYFDHTGAEAQENAYRFIIGNAYAEQYARRTVQEVLSAWQEIRVGESVGITVQSLIKENGTENLKDGTGVLHAGTYEITYKIDGEAMDAAPHTEKIVVEKATFSTEPVVYTDGFVYNAENLITASNTSALKTIAGETSSGFYPVVADTAPVFYLEDSAQTGAGLTEILNVGRYIAKFSTTHAAEDEADDYDCPVISVQFDVTPYVITGFGATASGEDLDGTTEQESGFLRTEAYTGKEINFMLLGKTASDADGVWNAILARNLTVTMQAAERLSTGHGNINSAFYYVNETDDNGQRKGNVSVAVAGTYEVSVRFGDNIEYAPSANEPAAQSDGSVTLKFKVTQAPLTVGYQSGNKIVQERTTASFALDVRQIRFDGKRQDIGEGISVTASFRPTDYKVYVKNADGSKGAEKTGALLKGNYIVEFSAVTANNYKYPRVGNNLLADFTYMENYILSPSTVALDLEITEAKLQPLVRNALGEGTGVDADHFAVVTYEAKDYDIVDFFTTTETNAAYSIAVKRYEKATATAGSEVTQNADGTFTLNAGYYLITVDKASEYVWADGGEAVSFYLQINKQVVSIASIAPGYETFNGGAHTLPLGSTESYWADLAAKGVTANIYTDQAATQEVGNAFDANGSVSLTNAGAYYIRFCIPANNYCLQTEKVTDFDYAESVYKTDAVKIAEIAKMQIAAPALGAQRLTATNTAHDFSGILTGTVTFDSGNIKTVTYSVEKYVCNNGTHTSLSGEDSSEGLYAAKLTVTGYTLADGSRTGGENFVWVRNGADVTDIAYTITPDIEGFKGTEGEHVAYLHYVTITQTLDISCNGSASFLYGGYDIASPNQNWDNVQTLNGNIFKFSGDSTSEIKEENKTYTYVNSNGEQMNAENFKTWDAGAYIGTVNITIPNTTYLPMSFNVAVTVEKLPVSLVVSGGTFYGNDEENAYAPTLSYGTGSKHFLNASGAEMTNVPLRVTHEIDKTSPAMSYGADAFTLVTQIGDIDYSKNYNVTYTSAYEITKAGLTLTVGTGTGEYGSVHNYYAMLGNVILPNGDKLADAVTVSPSIPDNAYTNGRLNAGEYRVDFAEKDGNYAVTFNGNAYNTYTVTKAQAHVQIDISLVYGEAVDATKTVPAAGGGIYAVTYSGMVEGESAGATGNASFSVNENGIVTYASGLASTNYTFVDIGENGVADAAGKVSYRALDITVSIDNVAGDYNKPQRLTYTVTVNSVSSYAANGEKIALSEALREELGVDANGKGAMWSKGVTDVNFNGEPFVITTSAYDAAPEEGSATGATANVGDYPIVGMTNAEFAAMYEVAFTGNRNAGGRPNTAGTYTVNKVKFTGGNIIITTDPNATSPDGGIVIVIKPAGNQKTDAQQPAAVAFAENVVAEQTAANREAVPARSRAAASLAATVENEPEAHADAPVDSGYHYTLPYDEQWHILMSADVSGGQGDLSVMYNMTVGEGKPAPEKTDAGWTTVPPQAIDAGYYTVYFYLKPLNNNYEESGIYYATVEITAATDNEIVTDFNFANNKAFKTEQEANADAAWTYGLYAENAQDGFNLLGNQAVTELGASYAGGSSWSYALSKDGTPVAFPQGITFANATALFNYMFNNGDGNRFGAGVYCLTVTQTVSANPNGIANYNGVSASYYFKVAKRDIEIKADGATVVYGEDIDTLTAIVTGLVRNNYHASDDGYAAVASGLYTVSCAYTAGTTNAGAELPISIALTDAADALSDNYNLPTAENGLTGGTLTVTKRTVAIQIRDIKTATYGDSSFPGIVGLGYEIITQGLPYTVYEPFGNHVVVTLEKQAITSTTDAGNYPIYAVWNTDETDGGSADHATNYNVVFVNCSYGETLNVANAIGNGETFSAGTYTVNKKVIDVAWNEENGSSYEYDGTPRTFTASAAVNGVNVELTIIYAKKAGDEYVPLEESAKPTGAGEYKVSASFDGERYPNYTTGGSSITVTITKANATVTANDASVVYGNELKNGTGYGITVGLPEFATAADKAAAEALKTALNKFCDEDDESKVYYTVYTDRAGTTQYEAGTGVGTYRIVIDENNVLLDNFNLVCVAGEFTVSKRAVEVTVGNLTKEYDGNYVSQQDVDGLLAETNGGIFSYDVNLVTGDDYRALGIVLSVTNALNAGSYDFAVTSNSANYDVTFAEEKGNLIITQKQLTVTASATVTYGDALQDSNVVYAFDGFVAGESFESLRAISNATSDNAMKPVTGALGYRTDYAAGVAYGNTPALTPDFSDLQFLNYRLSVGDAPAGSGKNQVTVLRRTLGVTANGFVYRTEGYDEELAELTNIVSGDTVNVTYAITDKNGTTVSALTNVGDYAVTVTLDQNGDGNNYEFANGGAASEAVTVTVAPLAINIYWEGNSQVDLDEASAANGVNKILNGYVHDAAIMEYAFVRELYDEESGENVVTPNLLLTTIGDAFGIKVGLNELYNMGTYRITVTLKSGNYCWQNPDADDANNCTVAFSAISVRVTLDVNVPADAVYSGAAQYATASVGNGSSRDVTFTYYEVGGDYAGLLENIGSLTKGDMDRDYAHADPVDAGYYIVYAEYAKGNKGATKFAAFVISPKAVGAPLLQGEATRGYNGAEQIFTVTGFESYMSFEGAEGVVSGNTIRFAAKDAHVYTVTFKLDGGNYVWAEEGTETLAFAVVKANDQAVALDESYTFTYGEQIAIDPVVKYTDGNVISTVYYLYDVKNGQPGTQLGSTPPRNAGVYYVAVTVAETDNYNTAVEDAVIVIEKKEVKVSISVNVPYGQTVTAGDVYYTLSGLQEGEDADSVLSVNLTAIALGISFGEGDGLRDAGRYKPTFATAETVVNGYTGKIVNGLAGFFKRGSADNYYYTADENSYVTVSPLAVSVVIGSASGIYGATANFNGVSLRWADSVGNQLIPEADRAKQGAELMKLLGVSASSFVCDTEDGDAGSYAITVSRYSNANYNVTFVDGIYEIRKVNMSVEWTVGGGSFGNVIEPKIDRIYLYIGTGQYADLSSALGQKILEGIKFQFTDATGNQLFAEGEIPENAGEYFVQLVFAAEGKVGKNYALVASSAALRRFNVGKLVLEVEDLRVDKGDDGLKLAYTGNVITPTLVETDWKDYYTVSASDENAKTVGTYYMTVTLNDFDNVQWSVGRTADYRLAFEIVKARNSLEGDLVAEGWTYGDDARTPTAKLKLKDMYGNDIPPIFEYSANNGADWTTVVPTEAGTYRVRVRANATANVEEFVSGNFAEFTVARRTIGKPQIEVTAENNVYSGNVLLANVSGFDQRLMAFEYVGNFTVDGNSIALTALNAGTYTLRVTLSNANYVWADGDEEKVFEQIWTVAPKRLEKPTGGKNSFLVNGGVITYLPEGFDSDTMEITGNSEGHGGVFTAEISLKDSANYVWADETIDNIFIEWEIVGVNTVFKALAGVMGSIAGLALLAGVAQFVLFKRKQKREAAMDGDGENGETENSEANGEGGEEA